MKHITHLNVHQISKHVTFSQKKLDKKKKLKIYAEKIKLNNVLIIKYILE